MRIPYPSRPSARRLPAHGFERTSTSFPLRLLTVLVTLFASGALFAQEFRRGDVDQDGVVSMADASYLQHYLLVAGSPPSACEDAADINDDGSLTILDVVDIVQVVMGIDEDGLVVGPCVEDLTADPLSCVVYNHCPDVTLQPLSDLHFLSIGDHAASLGAPTVVSIEYDNLSSSRLAAVSFGVTHDETLATVTTLEFGSAILDLPFAQPQFWFLDLTPGGWVAGAVFQFYGTIAAPLPGTGLELYRATYELTSNEAVPLAFSGELRTPPVEIRIHSQSTAVRPQLENGSLFPATFVRGDTNADGQSDIADVIFQLNELFAGGPASPCRDAADVNDDGALDLGDPIFGLGILFGGSGQVPLPPTECGVDPTPDTVDCVQFPPCF